MAGLRRVRPEADDARRPETHSAQGDMLIRDILKRMRHDGCGGRPGRAELLTGIEGGAALDQLVSALQPPKTGSLAMGTGLSNLGTFTLFTTLTGPSAIVPRRAACR
jgi:hypothetical protein